MHLFDIYDVSRIGDREVFDLIVAEEHRSADDACEWICQTRWLARTRLLALLHDPARPAHFSQPAKE